MTGKDFRKIGLATLQMRLPRLRETVEKHLEFAAKFSDLLSAYGEAVDFRDRLRMSLDPDPSLLADYEAMCVELEDELQHFATQKW